MFISTRVSGLAILAALAATALPAEEVRSFGTTAAKKGAAKAAATDKSTTTDSGPKTGIKTPGVKIPYSRLKAEAELPAAPTWALASDSVLIPSPSGSSVERIDLKANKLGEPISGVEKPCAGAVTAFKSVWVADCAMGTIVRMEPKSGKVEATLKVGAGNARSEMAATGDSVWAFTDDKTTLTRIDPDSNSVVAEVRLPAACNTLTFGESSLWVTCPTEDKLLRINPVTNLIEQRIKVAEKPTSVAIGDGSVWVLGLKDGKIDRVDPKTNKVVKTIGTEAPGAESGSIAIGEGSLWATLTGFPLMRIDTTADKEAVVQQFWGDGGGYLFTTTGAVWLSNTKQSTLVRLDPKRIIATLAE